MIDTIYFDNWNTLVKAPNLMRRGSSTEIFHRYLDEQGIDISYDLMIETYVPIAKAQEKKAKDEGHREPNYRQRIEDTFNKLGIIDVVNHSHGAWGYYLKKWDHYHDCSAVIRDINEFPDVLKRLESS